MFPRICLILLLGATVLRAAEAKTRHILFVTTDGLRWQEVFRGAEQAMMNKEEGGVPDAAALTERYGAPAPEERRERLMPFLWKTIAQQGQIFGNRDAGSLGDVTNGKWISYPGYSEFLTGHPDDRITSNKPIPNPNLNVLEWLNTRPGLAGKVYACNAWPTLRQILNVDRSKLPMFSTMQKSTPGAVSPRIAELEQWMQDIPSPWPDEHYDAFVQRAAVEFIDAHHPRVLYVNFGETDEWAHARRYDRYLEAAHRVDGWIGALWAKLQSMPEYRGTTTLVITTDHGRGETPQDWINHNDKVPHSGEWWCAVLGPDTASLGARKDCTPVKQAQIAASLAKFLGEDYQAAEPQAAAPLPDIFSKP
ncbi:MAG TPA: alkaline phosphatase family protein [Chthoniobacter sp.]|nr:alkaline phosphatase family protein [Chthoniobacter sp.]